MAGGARREKAAWRERVGLAFDEDGAAVPGACGGAGAERWCGEARSAQTREYAPLLVMGGGLRGVVEGGRCGGRWRGDR
ncbi:MAG: hypothetical protein ACHQ17_06810, partial [Polyangia bacterium]